MQRRALATAPPPAPLSAAQRQVIPCGSLCLCVPLVEISSPLIQLSKELQRTQGLDPAMVAWLLLGVGLSYYFEVPETLMYSDKVRS